MYWARFAPCLGGMGGGGGGLVNLYKEDKDREEKKKREVFMLQWSNVNSR